jgi:hypothetical protein
MHMESSAFEARVSDALNAALGTMAKAKREPPSEEGARKPTGRGGKHKRADKEQDGDTFRRRLGSSVRVVHDNLGDAERVGDVLQGTEKGPTTIVLNLGHAMVSRMFSEGNVDATVLLATALLEALRFEPRGQQLFKQVRQQESMNVESFSRGFGSLLSGLRLDGQKAKETA